MFIKYERRFYKGNPKTTIRIVEAYRNINGVAKQRPIKSFGTLENQPDQKAFMQMVEAELIRLNDEQKMTIEINPEDNHINGVNNIEYNYGYRYLEAILNFLDIEKYLDDYQKSLASKEKYQISQIFKFLVFERILRPDSKRATTAGIKRYFQQDFDFGLDDVYRALDKYHDIFDELQIHLRKKVNQLMGSDDLIYYDVTNYFTEIDFNDIGDGLRKKGVSKEHRLDPIVGMGLFMDEQGLPLSIKVFPGNTAESVTFMEAVSQIKKQHNIKRICCVADKGINSLGNIEELIKNGDGYVFSQILRGKKGSRYHAQLFTDSGWVYHANQAGELISAHKNYEETVILKDGSEHRRQVLLTWDKREAIKQSRKRQEALQKAENSLTNKTYLLDHSYKKYLLKEQPSKVEVNYSLADDESRFDGYHCIVTSELEYSPAKIKQAYGGLWEIEESFRITKTNLEFRPLYHFKKERIKAHFLICFTALLVVRLFQKKLKDASINLSVERIVRVLNKMNVKNAGDHQYNLSSISGARAYKQYVNEKGDSIYSGTMTNEDEIELDLNLIYLAFKVECWKAYIKIEEFKRYLKKIKF